MTIGILDRGGFKFDLGKGCVPSQILRLDIYGDRNLLSREKFEQSCFLFRASNEIE